MASRTQFEVEPLEPRVLLSGDGVALVSAAVAERVELTVETAQSSLQPAASSDHGAGATHDGFLDSTEDLAGPTEVLTPDPSQAPDFSPAGVLPVEPAQRPTAAVQATAQAQAVGLASLDAIPGSDPNRPTAPVEPPVESVAAILVQTLRASNGPPEHAALSAAPASAGNGTASGITQETVNSPGNTPGKEEILNAEAWSATEEYRWDIASVLGTEGVSWDLVDIQGNPGTLTINATKAQEFLLSIHAPGPLVGFQNTQSYSWRILRTAGGVVGFDRSDIVVDSSGFVAAGNSLGAGRFVVDQSADGHDLLLRFVPQAESANLLTEAINWNEEGPFKVTGNGNTIIPPDNPVIGAVQEIALHPTDPTVAFLASVGGGIWKTTNFNTPTPTWDPIGDALPALGITAIAVSPRDADDNTVSNATPQNKLVLYAGLGSFSSSHRGATPQGLYRSRDGGQTWLPVAGFRGLTITRILPSFVPGGPIYLATQYATKTVGAVPGLGGLYRSTDGTAWDRLSGPTGLKEFGISDLIQDPSNPGTIYAAVASDATADPGIKGIYKSTNADADNVATISWSKKDLNIQPDYNHNGVFGEAGEANLDKAVRIRLSMSRAVGHTVFTAVGGDDSMLAGVFSSATQGDAWTRLGAAPNIGDQADMHLSLAADPLNSNWVYLAGTHGGVSPWVAGIYRGDWVAGTWTKVTSDDGVGPAPNTTAPHADVRSLAFAANDNDLLAATDGGIYRLNNPRPSNLTPKWEFIGSGLRLLEISHGLGYDHNTNSIFVGAQDNGVSRQTSNPQVWANLSAGDGSSVATSYDGTTSTRYFFGNNFTSLRRADFTNPLDPDSFGPVETMQLRAVGNAEVRSGLENVGPYTARVADRAFVSGFQKVALAVNRVEPSTILIGRQGLYRSTDRGDTISPIVDDPNPKDLISNLLFGGRAGGFDFPGVIYTVRGKAISVRGPLENQPRAADGSFTQISPDGAGLIKDVATDPENWRTAFAVDSGRVYLLIVSPTDGSITPYKITGNLGRVSQLRDYRSVEVLNKDGHLAVVVGAADGVYVAYIPDVTAITGAGAATDVALEWTRLGEHFPNVIVTQLLYDEQDDLLVAGTLGRGAWSLEDAKGAIFQDFVLRVDTNTASDEVRLRVAPPEVATVPTLQVLIGPGQTVIGTFELNTIRQIVVHTGAGNDNLIVDSANGEIVVPGEIHFYGDEELVGDTDDDTLTFTGPSSSGLETRTEGNVKIRQMGEQVVHAVDVESFANSTAGETFLNGLKAFWRFISWPFRKLADLISPDVPVMSDTLMTALNGGHYKDEDPESDESADSPEAGGGGGNDSRSLLDRLFEDGGFSFADLGVTITDANDLRAKLDALDEIPNNVVVDPVSRRLSLGILGDPTKPFRRRIETTVGMDTELFGGLLRLNGNLDISVAVDLYLEIASDAHGFYIRTDAGAPEIRVHDFEAEGDVEITGNFGIVRVVLSAGELEVGDGVGIAIDLKEPPDAYGNPADQRLRIYDLASNPASWMSFALTGDPLMDDLAFTAGIRIAGMEPGDPPLFDFPLVQLKFAWADISKPLEVRVEPVSGPGDLLMRLISFSPSDLIGELDRMLTSFDKLQTDAKIDVDVPFGGGFSLKSSFDFAKAFRDKVFAKLVDLKLVASTGGGSPSADLLKGRLSANTVFNLDVGGEKPVKVTVNAAATLTNQNLQDLVDDFNNSLQVAGLGGKVTAYLDNQQIALKLISGTKLKITGDANDPAFSELGFSPDSTGLQIPKLPSLQGIIAQLNEALDPDGPGPLSFTITPAFDVPNKRLTFALEFKYGLNKQASFKYDTDLGLGNIVDLSATGKFNLNATLSAKLTLGIDFASEQTPGLRTNILVPVPASGQLTAPTTFRININDGTLSSQFTLGPPQYGTNSSIAELVTDLNSLLAGAPDTFQGQPLSKVLRFIQTGTSISLIALNEVDADNDSILDPTEDTNGDGIRQLWLDKVNSLAVLADPGSTAATELGFTPGNFARSRTFGVFVQDVALSGKVMMDGVGLGANARFGVFGLETSGGEIHGKAEISLGLKNPQDGTTRIDIGKMFSDLGNLGNYIAPSFTLSGDLKIDLKNIKIKPNLLDPFPAGAAVTIFIPDIKSLNYNPDPYKAGSNDKGIFVTYPELNGLGDFNCLTFTDVINALDGLADQLEEMRAFRFLGEPLPLINISIGDILNFASDLADAIQGLANGDAQTLDKLEQLIETKFGLGDDVLEFSVDHTNNPVIAGGVATFNPAGPKNALRFTGPNGIKIKFVADDGVELAPETNTAKSTWNATDKVLTIYFNAGYTTAATVAGLADQGGTTIDVDNVAEPGSGPGAINTTVLKLQLAWSSAYGNFLPLQLSLGDLVALLPAGPVKDALLAVTDFVQVEGSAKINVTASADLSFTLGIDVSNPCSWIPFVDDAGTQISLNAAVRGTDLDFKVAIGGLGLFVKDGTVTIDGDGSPLTTNDNASFSVGLKDNNGDGRHYFRASETWFDLNNIAISLNAVATARLPLYFPTASLPAGGSAADGPDANTFPDNWLTIDVINVGTLLTSLIDDTPLPGGILTISTPDITSLFDDFNVCDLITNSPLLLDGLDAFLGSIQGALSAEVFDRDLPLVGDKLGKAADVIGEFREGLLADLRAKLAEVGDPIGLVKEAIFNALGKPGLDILAKADGTPLTSFDQIDIQCTEDTVTFNLRLKKSAALVDTSNDPINFDIGIPGFGLKVNGNVKVEVGFDFKLKFAISASNGFYFDTSDPEELKVEFKVTIPGLKATGQLLFLQLDVADDSDGKDALGNDRSPSSFAGFFSVNIKDPIGSGNRLTFADLISSGVGFDDIIEATLGAKAELNLDFAVSFGGDARFPRLVGEFDLDWEWTLGGDDGGDLSFGFHNIQIDIGSFISEFIQPILKEIKKVTEPFQPLIEVITTPIPILSDIFGEPVTMLDLAEMSGYLSPSTVEFIKAVAKIIDLVNHTSFSNGSILIPLGSFELDVDSAGNVGRKAGDPDPAAEKLSEKTGDNDAKSFLQDLEDLGFKFPFLSISELFKLFMGKPISIVEYHMPVFEFTAAIDFQIPIYPPLYAVFGGQIGAKIDMTFGFDTYGLQKFFASEDKNPLDILDGFYVKDVDDDGNEVTEFTLSGGITAGAELALGPIELGVRGGLFAEIGFDLNDPDNDGKVRVSEIVALALEDVRCIFDIHGRIYVALEAYLRINLFILTIDETWRFGEITLAEFDLVCPQPVLADVDGNGPGTEASGGPGVLTLHMGEYAGMRVNGNTTDGSENYTVVHIDGAPNQPNGETVEVSFNGIKQTYFGVKSVIVKAGAGNDRLDVRGVLSPANVHGGSGDDTLYAGRAATGNKFFGDDGNDTLIGEEAQDAFEGADDEFHGGAGEDQLTGNEGDDKLYGDEGDDTLTANDGDDFLDGGTGNDTLLADSGDDEIHGGDGADTITGADGADKIFGEGGNDSITGDAGADWIIGGDGDDVIDGGVDDDVILGDDGTIVSPLVVLAISGDGDDTIAGGAGQDTLFSADGNDQVFGGTFLTSGQSQPAGIDGRDFIDAGLGNDLVFADDAHSGQATVMPGGTVGDLAWFDVNHNGVRDPGDNRVPGVKVELHRDDNSLVGKTTTDAAGAYKFTGLLPGKYYVLFSKPTGLQYTDPDQGSDDEQDSDANTVTGRSPIFELETGGSNLTLDVGFKGTLPTVSIDDPSIQEGDVGAKFLTFTVSLSNPYDQEVSVCYDSFSGSGDGDARPIFDYDSVSWTLIFAPGETQKFVQVAIHGDNIDELDEVFGILLRDANHAVIDATNGVGTGTIIDDDDAPVITLGEGRQLTTLDPIPEITPVTFTVQLSNPSYQPIKVDWRTQQIVNADGTLKSDSARASKDYDDAHEYNPDTITFLPGQIERTIVVATKSDALDEFDERFNVVLAVNPTTPSDGATLGSPVAAGVIVDDDLEPYVRLKVLTPQPVEEGHAGKRRVLLELSLDDPSGREVSVQWNTAHGTAIGTPTASEAADYVYKFETIKFAEGVTVQNTFAEIIGDTVLEPNEYFFANLVAAHYAQIDTDILLSNNNHGRIEIANDEVPDPGPWYVEFSDAVYEVVEGETATITLVRAAGSTQPVAVYWTLGAPAIGTATPGLDYTDEGGAPGIWEQGKPGAAPRGIVRFAEGETTKTFTIHALSDTYYEGTEAAVLYLANPTGGAVRAPQRLALLRILDAQAPPELTLDDPIITEGDAGTSLVTFKITATVEAGVTTTQSIDVKWETFAGTALAGDDYVADNGLVTIPTFTGSSSATFKVKVVGDTVAELKEFFLARLKDPANAVIQDYEGKATIHDNDRQTISGFVFNDLNGNGFFDADSEYGLDGVKVTVKDSSGLQPVQITNDGKWNVDVLLGDIVVTADESTTPPNSACTTSNNPLTTQVTPTVIATQSMGFMVQPTKGKGAGNTASGNRGNNDTAYGGGGNDLIDGGNGDDWLIGGHWLGPGCACDGKPYDAKLKDQAEADGGHRYVDPATLPAFGTITGHVWLDTNGNNAQDEPLATRGLKDIQVNLYDDAWNLVGITYTDPQGNYQFEKVAPCKYSVQFIPPPEFRFVTQDTPIGIFLNPDAVDSDASALTGITAQVNISGNTVDLDAGMASVPNTSGGPWAIYFDHTVYSVRESDGFATIGLNRVPNSFQPVAVYFTQDGDIQPATLSDPDYKLAKGTVSYGAGEIYQSFLVPIVNDTKPEGYEVVLLLLKDPTGGDVKGRPNVARLLIFDNPCPDDDEIHGGDGDDILLGDFGYFTNAGKAELLGGLGNDNLFGEDGLDQIYGEGGNDALTGGADNDSLNGGGENDTYRFDGDLNLGQDAIAEAVSPFGGNDTIDLGATTGWAITFDLGSALVQNITPSLSIKLPAGNVIENVSGGARGDLLTGNSLDNRIQGNGGDDVLEGKDGNDRLEGGTGNDKYVFDADLSLGHDDLYEAPNVDTDLIDFSSTTTQSVSLNLDLVTSQAVSPTLTLKLHSKTGIEDLYGGSKDDTLLGNARDNRIQGGPGSDVLDGGAGYDVLLENRSGNFNLSTVSAATGQLTLGLEVNLFALASFEEISLVGDDNPNTLDASSFSGKVRLDGRGGNDTIKGGTGENILTGGPGNDTIVGLGFTTLVEERDADMVLTPGLLKIGALETDTISGITVAQLTGGASANKLDASGFDLAGTYVRLDGADGDDTLIGSPGDDTLIGGGGNDSISGGKGDDSYRFDTNDDLGSDVITELAGEGSDTVDFAGSQGAVTASLASALVQAVNANLSLRLSADNTFENLTGGSGGDTLIGNGLPNIIRGGPGDDSLTGLKGSDAFDGGAGAHDRIVETADLNMTLTNLNLVIGAELDLHTNVEQAILTGGDSPNTLDASAFTLGGVSLIGLGGIDVLRGGSKNDVLIGGAGNDELRGFTGSDTYVFDLEEILGSDSIVETSGVADTLDFSSTQSVAAHVDLAQAGAQVVAVGHLTLALNSPAALENVIGGDAGDTLRGNALGNVIGGGGGNDLIEGLGGDDTLAGGNGDDTYVFDADLVLGNDTVREGVGIGGVDTLDFSATSVDITVNLARGSQQTVVAGRLTLRLVYCHNIEGVAGGGGADVLIGNTLDNTLEGGGGDDLITGSRGNDRYLFDDDLFLGSDTLFEQPDIEGGVDTLDFSPTTLVAVKVSLGSQLAQAVALGHTLNLEWPPNDALAALAFENLIGGGGSDTLTGNSLANTIEGRGGNDTINGAAQADTISGGPGNDTQDGGLGNDTYVFDADLAAGVDAITEAPGGGIDTLDFSATTSLGVTVNLGIVAVQVVNPNLQLVLSGPAVIENIVGSAADDTFYSNPANNHFTGGSGDDTYMFDGDTSQGVDVIAEAPGLEGGIDTVSFQQTGAFSVKFDLSLDTAQNAVVDPGPPAKPNVVLRLSSGESIENLIGGTKDDLLVGNALGNRISGLAGKDTLKGGAGADTVVEARDADMVLTNTSLTIGSELDALSSMESAELTGGAGNNKLNAASFSLGPVLLDGGAGADQLTGGASAQDRVVATRDADMILTNTSLKIGAETDVLSGIEEATLTGGASPNLLDASAFDRGPVVLDGGAGTDTLRGGKRDDRLTGGSANDVIDGGLGLDTLVEQRDSNMVLTNAGLVLPGEADALSGIEVAELTGGPSPNSMDASAATTIAVTLDGTGGNDALKGGARDDVLIGGPGDDSLSGGNGSDRYVFEDEWGVDTINESPGGGNDRADLSGATRGVIALISTNVAITSGAHRITSLGGSLEEVLGTAAGDAFFVVPSPTLALVLDGGAGVGDVLNYDAQATATTQSTDTLKTVGFQPVKFAGFETVNILNPAPMLAASSFSSLPGVPALGHSAAGTPAIRHSAEWQPTQPVELDPIPRLVASRIGNTVDRFGPPLPETDVTGVSSTIRPQDLTKLSTALVRRAQLLVPLPGTPGRTS